MTISCGCSPKIRLPFQETDEAYTQNLYRKRSTNPLCSTAPGTRHWRTSRPVLSKLSANTFAKANSRSLTQFTSTRF
uniref:Uncharacterized protein n=1 Tax=Mycena chlorophos TaxID=658473 RepID=A0ABQ0LXH0_MYCCL|nr:predicted protein [Mycena chlorophos]